MKQTVFETANMLQSLKLHFTKKKHDYFKTPYVVTQHQLSLRRDKYALEKLTKLPDLFNYLVAVLHKQPNLWTTDLLNEENKKKYLSWKKRQQSLAYTFQQEIACLHEPFNSNIVVKDDQHPQIIKKYLSKQLSLETLLILVEVTQCMPYLNRVLKEDFIWKELSFLITKYSPFVQYNKKDMQDIILKTFKHK